MILYELRCSGDHAFEAWFRDSTAYDEQAGAGAIACPVCGDAAVRKAPMAPRIAKGRGDAGGDAGGPGGDAGATRKYAHAQSPGMRKALAEMRREVEENCDYVGEEFAEEARKIHYGEAGERNIYGEATDDEAQELTDEGIKVGKIPWLPRTDS